MTRSTTFTRGSGLYSCRLCTRATRDDGNGDSVNLGLCTQCFELGGLENVLQDGGTLRASDLGTIRADMRVIAERGGRDVWGSVFAAALGGSL